MMPTSNSHRDFSWHQRDKAIETEVHNTRIFGGDDGQFNFDTALLGLACFSNTEGAHWLKTSMLVYEGLRFRTTFHLQDIH